MPARAALAAACLALALHSAAASGLKLNVPSPDWRDQVIYFVVTDRFADGDPRNDDQGEGEYRPGNGAYWQGGDLKGLTDKLDYVRGLGATAVWITPPVANRAIAPALGYTGYHGYWAEHFEQIDPHLGTLADYRRLSSALHRRGLYLVQDIVVNHTADYFHYEGGWDAADPARFYVQNPDPRGRTAPRQWPFSMNDPRIPAQRRAGVYHWTPDLSDYNDPLQERNYQMSGLDDLNTENPLVRRALRDSYAYWIRAVGVDAFRVDTAFYVPPEFYVDFLYSREPHHPGVMAAARATGRRDFLVFGEGFGIDAPGQTRQARKIESYMHAADGTRRLPAMLNFPLYGSLNAVYARGAPTAELAFRIESMTALHSDVHRMPTFVDNHDVDRFLAAGSVTGLEQALLALMTLPGIPVIYYGTEQGFTRQRAAMFAAGVDSGGRDHYDTTHPLYRVIAALTALRREHRVLSRGAPRVLARDASGAGALMWAMAGGGQDERLYVAFNTAEHTVLIDNAELRLAPGTRLRPLYAIEGGAPELVAGEAGRASFALPPLAGYVWAAAEAPPAARATPPGAAASWRIDTGSATEVEGDFEIRGSAEPGAGFLVVVDGRLDEARHVAAAPDGRWAAHIDTASMVDPSVQHRVVAYADGVASAPHLFRVRRAWRLVADVADPAGDDHGPRGGYAYPSDPGWGANRQLDIRRVRLYTSGGALRVEASMNRVTQGWNPPNGFDHVAFTIFVELPGQPAGSGARVMPLQNAELPPGMRWHRRLRVNGWTNALFGWDDASARDEGRPLTPAARIEVQRDTATIVFTLPAAALGDLASLSGAKVYLSTWDYDAGFRLLERKAGSHTFGGATGVDDPLVMDDTAVIDVP